MIDWWGNTTGKGGASLFAVSAFAHHGMQRMLTAQLTNKVAETMFTDSAVRTSVAAERFFDPAAKRVGDRGDGRGVRYPTYFNEDIIQCVRGHATVWVGVVAPHQRISPMV